MTERDDSNAWRGYAALGFVILIIAVFIGRFVLVPLLVLRLGTAAVTAAVEAAAIVGIGAAAHLLFARLSSRPVPRISVATDFLIGYPLFGTLAFLIGMIAVNPATMMLPIICGLASLALRQRSRAVGLSPRAWSEGAGGRGKPIMPAGGVDRGRVMDPRGHAFTPLPFLATAVIVTVLGCGLLAVQTPPSSLDELAYHLSIPKTWAMEGRAIDLPLLSHSYFPLGIESADLPLFSLVRDDAGYASHILHFFAAFATLLVCRRFLARHTWPTTALVGTAAIVSIPALAVTAGWSLVDWPLAGLSILLASSVASDETASAPLGLVVAAGMLTKYTFWPIAAVAIVATLLYRRPRGMKSIGGGLLLGMVFPLRNLILTGNPIAPFLSAGSPGVAGYRDAGTITATFAGYVFDGRFVDEALGITVLALTFLYAVASDWREQSSRALFAGGTLLLAGVLSLTTPSARILVPYLCIPALFGVIAIDRLAARTRRSVLVALTIGAALQSLVIVYFMTTTEPLALVTGRMSEEQYLARSRPSFSAIRWTDQQLPRGSRTLVIGLHELYAFEHSVRGSGNFDGDRMSAYLSPSRGDQLPARLHTDGFTHVAVFAPSLVPVTASTSKMEERTTRLSPAAAANLQTLLANRATPVARSDSATLYRLR